MTESILPPILFLLLLLWFYYGLPVLKDSLLPSFSPPAKPNPMGKKDLLVLGGIVLVYSFAAFFRLGSTTAPQSYREFAPGAEIVVELDSPAELDSVMVWSSLGTGVYAFDVSEDGNDYVSFGQLEQNYANILKWHSVIPETDPCISVRYLRITVLSGPVRLGELGLYARDGSLLSYRSDYSALNDEQELVPESSNYLNSSYFDEIYHVRTAQEGIEGSTIYEISHPPLGKIIISLGIRFFGLTPFGWRFMGTLFGVLMLPVIYVFARKLFDDTVVAGCTTVVFAFDFMHYVQTRIATIDTYGVFFILLMYLFMFLYIRREGSHQKQLLWLALSGISFGFGCACKWICVYAGGGLAVIWLICRIQRLRRKEEHFADFLRNSLFCVIFFVLLPCLIYYLSYYPYGKALGLKGFSMYFIKQYLLTVLDNQKYMLNYHVGVNATHPYSSRWYQWLLDIRPILYYLEYGADGTRSSFGAWVSPVVCWGGLFALFVLGYAAIVRKERTALFLLIGYLAQLLPWVFISRLTFAYHYFPCTVFLSLSLGYIFSVLKKSGRAGTMRMYVFAGASVALFLLFYPAISGVWVNNRTASLLLRWLPTWPF